jgi:hypothetical protein
MARTPSHFLGYLNPDEQEAAWHGTDTTTARPSKMTSPCIVVGLGSRFWPCAGAMSAIMAG